VPTNSQSKKVFITRSEMMEKVENLCCNRKCFSAKLERIILEYVLIKNNFDDASDTSGIGKEETKSQTLSTE